MDDFETYINDLKAAVDLIEVIGQDEPLEKHGNSFRGVRHDSLQVTPGKGLWNWHSRHIGGDVFTWLKEIRGWDFKRAVEELARRYNMPVPEWSKEDAQARIVAQARYDAFTVAATYFRGALRNSEAAIRYCKRRGWTGETVRDERIGYWGGDKAALAGEFKLHGIDPASPVARALLAIPAPMIVYVHSEFGSVRYITTRYPAIITETGAAFLVWNAETDTEIPCAFQDEATRKEALKRAREAGKRHYNLPVDLAGGRRAYWNNVAGPGNGDIVVVEGQADAVTLAQWGIPAVALCGVSIDDTVEGARLLHLLARHTTVYWATDCDDAGALAARRAADILGPLIRIVQWPDHDADDWLMHDAEHATAEAAAALLKNARPYVQIYAERIGQLPDYEKPEGLKRLVTLVSRMDDAEQAVWRKALSDAANISVRVYDRLLEVARGAGESDDDDEPEPLPFTAVGGIVDDVLLEMLYIPPEDQPANSIILQGGKTLFAVRHPDKRIETAPHFDHNGTRYYPLMPETPFLREGIVIFPQAIGELLEPHDLIMRIRTLIHKYVDVDEFYETLAAYYVLFTWFYDAFPTLSYLRVKGDAGSGKTRFLEVVGAMCYRTMFMNAGASVSAMFRIMNVVRGTLVLDEGDFQKSDESSDIAKLLNVGNQRRQAHISRSGSKERDFETEFFNVYGPKVISTRKSYDDNAIESRCLTKEMGAPTSRTDIPRNLPDTFWTVEVPALQAALLRYRLEHWSPDINRREIPIDDSVEPRLQQVTDSLKRMVHDPDLLRELNMFIRAYNNQMVLKRGMQTEAKVLEALYILSEIQGDTPESDRDFSLGTIAAIANDMIDYENDEPIEDWSRYKDKERHRKLSAKGTGLYITENLQLRTERKSSDRRRRYHVVWDAARIEALWERFGLVTNEEKMTLMETYWEIQRLVKEHERNLFNQRFPN